MDKTKKCEECRESGEAVWIEAPWATRADGTHPEWFVCEKCFNHLNVKAGLKTVKGSQWRGEGDVEYQIPRS